MSLKKMMMVVLLLVLHFIAPSAADIISLNIRSSGQHKIRLSEFVFSDTGHVSFEISSVSVTSSISQTDTSRIGFFLLSHDLLNEYFLEFKRNPSLCVLNNKFISLLFTFQNLRSSFNTSYPVSSPGVYSLYFANCNRQSLVSIDGRTELYNLDDGTTKDYLSAGLTHLPSVYFIFSVLYLSFLRFWISVCVKNQRRFHMIHLLMGVLLVITIGHFICAEVDLHYQKVTGTRQGMDVLVYIFQVVRCVLLYTLIALIGMGWCLWNPFLHAKEKLFLLIVILLQVLANVCSIKGGVTGLYNEDRLNNWQLDFISIDFVFCLAIFIPFVGSLILLKKTCETDRNAARNMANLGSFVLLVFAYVLFTRIIVSAFATFVVYKNPWMINAAEETVSLVFCMVMFYLFRPCEDEEADEDEKATGMVDEEFGVGLLC
ncbi:hypothetical protein Lser_V15G18632 [Lactuca serriola]